jgi:mannitol-1-phosphate 5-dehydrogenase
MMKRLVLFGAGKIGRSFIGQLFARSGFEIVFVDISETLVNELNSRHEYDVIIKSDHPDTTIKIKNLRGILASQELKVAEEIADAEIVAVSVGQIGLAQVISILARGLQLRQKKHGFLPLDIILAENMRNVDQYVRGKLKRFMGYDYPLEELVGLIETSIGKMVPIMPLEVQRKDPLVVYAEPYNTLILDKKAFRNPIPEVEGLAPKENMKAWVDRKSYIHNLGHAATAYSGFLAEPDAIYIAEVLKNKAVKKFARSVMMQSAVVLMRKYPGEFRLTDLVDHIDDLLFRFGNRALGDTVFRVGCDLKRKLHRNDRILSPLIDGLEMRSPVNKIILTFSYGLCFRARDENGKLLPGDAEFERILNKKGLAYVLSHICSLNPEYDHEVIQRILSSKWNVMPIQLTLQQYFAPLLHS